MRYSGAAISVYMQIMNMVKRTDWSKLPPATPLDAWLRLTCHGLPYILKGWKGGVVTNQRLDDSPAYHNKGGWDR